jgi:hypothetical protein
MFKHYISGELVLASKRMNNRFKVGRSCKKSISFQCTSDLKQVSRSNRNCNFFVHLNLSEDSDHMIAVVKFCCTTHTCSDCIEYDEDCNNITEEVASKRRKNNHPIKYFTDSPNSLISNIHIPPNPKSQKCNMGEILSKTILNTTPYVSLNGRTVSRLVVCCTYY